VAFKYKTKIKKRYWVIPLICLELASIPFSIGLIGYSFNLHKDPVTAILIGEEPGKKRYAVASEKAFFIKADDFKGPIFVSAQNNKTIGDVTFGENAHLPSPMERCSVVTSEDNIIYQSHIGTTATDGHISTQAIVITVHYDASDSPKIEFFSDREQRSIPSTDYECAVKWV